MDMTTDRLPGSFRDPSGFLFKHDDVLYRQINDSYRSDYDLLMQSGLYEKLVAEELLIPHKEVNPPAEERDDEPPGHCEAHVRRGNLNPYKTIQPEHIPFISYPYEWCFSQLKNAALTTLKIQKIALEYGMSLKDASTYNIQFFKGKSILIDTLSFEIYKENQPWVAYRQFCQHFLAPLALMAHTDVGLSQLFRIHMDGIPLDLTSKLLPANSWLRFSLLSHIHLHAKAQKRYEKTSVISASPSVIPASPSVIPASPSVIPAQAGIQYKSASNRKVSKHSLIALIHHLESAITALQWHPAGTEWAEYYEDTNYSQEAMTHKKQLVEAYITENNPRTVWDLGANTGVFSRIAAAKEAETIAFDVDPAAVEKNYRQMRENKETKMLPLCMDLTNPSPSIGWANEERLSLTDRGPADTVLALALIHHLAISNNLPFSHIAAFLSQVCRFLITEFVPKDDSQVQRLLRSREDVFPDYDQEHFEQAFSHHFLILKSQALPDTLRTIYLMRLK
ncbi:MAG: SAM-dependent methyltransferase [Syntrophus sp. (in: bacteria)]|nr:SAM-dependent methyltransferase [Syntrophus sp. (in: bacteria)]